MKSRKEKTNESQPVLPQLGVNIDHLATLRQLRGTPYPNLLEAVQVIELAGAHQITVHLREDRRHIQDDDVRRLRAQSPLKLNFEMAATREMVAIACDIHPEMAMLVPEGRQEITTEGGLDVIANRKSLEASIQKLRKAGISVSAFIDADLKQIKAAADLGVQVCEIHTGPYAATFYAQGRQADAPAVAKEIARITKAGEKIISLGMQFNAGHALNYANVQPIAALPGVRELHIGHAIVSRAVMVGMREAVRDMKRLMREAQAAGRKP